jgi:hypothetical protein
MPVEGVIGAGFGRTGTASMLVALEQVGFGPTMHMLQLLQPKESLIVVFRRMMALVNARQEKDKQKRQEYIRQAMEGYKSSVDFPACNYYQDMLEMYPNRKVILTVRGSAEEWYNSVVQTIGKFSTVTPLSDIGIWLFANITPPGLLFHKFMEKTGSDIIALDKARMMQAYEDRITEVKKIVPAERLLIFNVKEGWEPIAKFLEIPIPQTPFPKTNDAKQINEDFEIMRIVGWFFLVLYLVIAWAVGRRVLRRTKSKKKSE